MHFDNEKSVRYDPATMSNQERVRIVVRPSSGYVFRNRTCRKSCSGTYKFELPTFRISRYVLRPFEGSQVLDYIPDANAALRVLRLRSEQIIGLAESFKTRGDPNMARQLEDLADNIRSAERVLSGAISNALKTSR